MTRDEFWSQLDTVCASSDKSQSLLQISNLLQEAYQADLPLLIACKRTPGKIHHAYTMFDSSNPGLNGNRYLICFTNPAQCQSPATQSQSSAEPATLSLEERFRLIDEETPTPAEDKTDLSLEERFRLIDEGEDEVPQKKKRRRRKKSKSVSPMWNARPPRETAVVRTRTVLDYVKRSKTVGGLVFNVYDEKRSIALPKFMIV